MQIALGILMVVLNLVWAGLVVLGLPGTWLMVITVAIVFWVQCRDPHGIFSVSSLMVVIGLALAAEIWEFAAGAAGAKKAGASKRGTLGALIGGLLGGLLATVVIPIPIVGSIIGACLGAAIGAGAGELSVGRTMDESVRSGVGAGWGRFMGTLIKVAFAVAMWLFISIAAFWP